MATQSKSKTKKKFVPAKEVTLNGNANIQWRNELVSGRWKLSLNELRMLYVFASHIDKNESGSYRIPVRELGKAMGLDENEQYGVIKEVARKLRQSELMFEWYKTPKSKKKSWIVTGWVDHVIYDDEFSEVSWGFSDLVEPMLLQVKEAYVKAAAAELIAFKSVYSSRFLLLFTQWEKLHVKEITIQELKEHFGITDKYKLFADFKRKVIDPAMREIDLATDFKITATPIRVGRTYQRYRFIIERKKKPKTIKVEATPVVELTDEQQIAVDLLIAIGMSKDGAEQLALSYSLEEIKSKIDWAKEESKDNLPGFVRKALKEGWQSNPLFKENHNASNLTPEQQKEAEELRKEAEAAAAKKAAPVDIEAQKANVAEIRRNLQRGMSGESNG